MFIKTRPVGILFLEIAQVISKRSTCLRRRYGAIIVKDRVIVSTGLMAPPGRSQLCRYWKMCPLELNVPKGNVMNCVWPHAEQNAIINGDR